MERAERSHLLVWHTPWLAFGVQKLGEEEEEL